MIVQVKKKSNINSLFQYFISMCVLDWTVWDFGEIDEKRHFAVAEKFEQLERKPTNNPSGDCHTHTPRNHKKVKCNNALKAIDAWDFHNH